MKNNKKSVSKKVIANTPVDAIIYTRSARPDGMDKQIKSCGDFAESKNHSMEERAFFHDQCSGLVPLAKRPGLKKTLRYIDKFPERKFVVVANDTSRIARDIGVLNAYVKALRSRGVSLEFVK